MKKKTSESIRKNFYLLTHHRELVPSAHTVAVCRTHTAREYKAIIFIDSIQWQLCEHVSTENRSIHKLFESIHIHSHKRTPRPDPTWQQRVTWIYSQRFIIVIIIHCIFPFSIWLFLENTSLTHTIHNIFQWDAEEQWFNLSAIRFLYCVYAFHCVYLIFIFYVIDVVFLLKNCTKHQISGKNSCRFARIFSSFFGLVSLFFRSFFHAYNMSFMTYQSIDDGDEGNDAAISFRLNRISFLTDCCFQWK